MIKLAIALLIGCAATLALAYKQADVFLPDDCDAATIVVKGFKLTLELDDAKKEWNRAAQESAKVEVPRRQNSEVEVVVVNENLEPDTGKGQADTRDYGPIQPELLEWIQKRATAMTNHIGRYKGALGGRVTPANRVVVQVLLLNTLVDLNNLIKEKGLRISWLRRKLNGLVQDEERGRYSGGVTMYVRELIRANQKIEASIRGANVPSGEWFKNMQALKRILHEQRFSQSLGEFIVDYINGDFHMMRRSTVYENSKPQDRFDDGLVYPGSEGHVPAQFPFSAQYMISSGLVV